MTGKRETIRYDKPKLDRKLLQDQDRNITDSRWNIFTAIKMAAAPYKQVERKISTTEFQWYGPVIKSLQSRLTFRIGTSDNLGVSSTPGSMAAIAGTMTTIISGEM